MSDGHAERFREYLARALRARGCPADESAEKVGEGRKLGRSLVAAPRALFMAGFRNEVLRFVAEYEAAEASVPADGLEIARHVTAHERAILEFADREIAGRKADSPEPVLAFLSSPPRAIRSRRCSGGGGLRQQLAAVIAVVRDQEARGPAGEVLGRFHGLREPGERGVNDRQAPRDRRPAHSHVYGGRRLDARASRAAPAAARAAWRAAGAALGRRQVGRALPRVVRALDQSQTLFGPPIRAIA
jgi:hypothetical protein